MRTFNKDDYMNNFFGNYRFFDILHHKHDRKPDEIFFSIEPRDEHGNYLPNQTYGYMVISPKMADFIKNEFFTGCNGIKFIEWENSWNVVFNEAQILGGIHFEISKEEFKTIFPDFTKTLAIEDDKEIERE